MTPPSKHAKEAAETIAPHIPYYPFPTKEWMAAICQAAIDAATADWQAKDTALRAFIREQAELASHSNAEWTAYAGVESGQAAYRSGMWWAFHRVEDFMGPKSL